MGGSSVDVSLIGARPGSPIQSTYVFSAGSGNGPLTRVSNTGRAIKLPYFYRCTAGPAMLTSTMSRSIWGRSDLYGIEQAW